jgi:large subunit ribosomal protein L29
MKIQDIRGMTDEELALAERNTSEEMWRLRFQHNTGQLTNTASVSSSRKAFARILTVKQERRQVAQLAAGEES